MGPNRKLQHQYYLDDIKTICPNCTQKYDKIEFFDIYQRTMNGIVGFLSSSYTLEPGTHWTDGRPIAGRPADTRKMKSAGRRGNIGPSADLVILELTEPADRPAVVRPMLRFFEHTQPADLII